MVGFKKRDSKDLFKHIARTKGVSVAEVKRDMVVAIEKAKNNPDPEKQAKFRKCFGSRTPTPEEVIYTIVKKVKT